MVYIRVPSEAQPGSIIGLTSHNTFTVCNRCGRETPMWEPLFPVKPEPNFFHHQFICVNCYVNEERFKQLDAINQMLGLSCGSEEDPDDSDMEEDEDE